MKYYCFFGFSSLEFLSTIQNLINLTGLSQNIHCRIENTLSMEVNIIMDNIRNNNDFRNAQNNNNNDFNNAQDNRNNNFRNAQDNRNNNFRNTQNDNNNDFRNAQNTRNNNDLRNDKNC